MFQYAGIELVFPTQAGDVKRAVVPDLADTLWLRDPAAPLVYQVGE